MTALQQLQEATSSVYTFEHIEGCKGLQMPIYRVSLEYHLAKHSHLLDPEKLDTFKVLLASMESGSLDSDSIRDATTFLESFLEAAIAIVEAGAPEFGGRIHVKRPVDAVGRPLDGHFTVQQLGAEFTGMLGAILKLSLPTRKKG